MQQVNIVPRHQELLVLHRLNGAVYVVGSDWLIGDTSLALVMPQERSLDIDTEMDIALAEALLRTRPWQ